VKIFFIIPPSIHYIEPYAYVEADKSNVSRPPLGILYVAAAVRESCDADLRIVDLNIGGASLAGLEEELRREQPDIVGFSVLTFNLLNCMEVCRVVRRASPATVICFGGWHPTLYPEETLNLGVADCIVMGEGEQSFCELSRALDRRGEADLAALEGIAGVGYRTRSGEVRIGSRREPIRDLDSLPFPAYELIDAERYSHLLATTDHVVSIMTSRGCPHGCSFCDLRRTPCRSRTPAAILEEIRHWHGRGVREFFIQDDNFTMNRRRALDFCRLLAASGLDITYKISSRVDHLDNDLLAALKASGCARIYLGVESGSQKMLDYLEKGVTLQQTRDTFRLAQVHGIDCCAYIMIGIPDEGKEEIEQTRRFVKELRPRHLQCSICTPMPETKLYHNLMEQGVVIEDYWRAFARCPDPAFRTRFASSLFSGEELRRMQNAMQRSFYWSPRIIWREIHETRGLKGWMKKTRLALRILFS